MFTHSCDQLDFVITAWCRGKINFTARKSAAPSLSGFVWLKTWVFLVHVKVQRLYETEGRSNSTSSVWTSSLRKGGWWEGSKGWGEGRDGKEKKRRRGRDLESFKLSFNLGQNGRERNRVTGFCTLHHTERSPHCLEDWDPEGRRRKSRVRPKTDEEMKERKRGGVEGGDERQSVRCGGMIKCRGNERLRTARGKQRVCVWRISNWCPFSCHPHPPPCDAAALGAAFADSPLTHRTSRSETHAPPHARACAHQERRHRSPPRVQDPANWDQRDALEAEQVVQEQNRGACRLHVAT